ncbi:MAG: helix-turn-helix transcriptional regulator [Niastella sp.]|nr:helix-turn-helix transcriptional regulator [Niastella sp.]
MQNQEHITLIDQYVIDLVRELRTKKEMTQHDLAAAIGLSRSFVSDVESPKSRAKYNVRHINALADYFGMSPKDFMPDKPFPVDGPAVKEAAVKEEKAVKKKASARKATPKTVAKKVLRKGKK